MKNVIRILVVMFCLPCCESPDVNYTFGEDGEDILDTGASSLGQETEIGEETVEIGEETVEIGEETVEIGEETDLDSEQIAEPNIWSCRTKWHQHNQKLCSSYQGENVTEEYIEETAACDYIKNSPCPLEDCYSTYTVTLADGVERIRVIYDDYYDSGYTTIGREMCEGVEDVTEMRDTDPDTEPEIDTDTEEEEDKIFVCYMNWWGRIINASCAEYTGWQYDESFVRDVLCASGEFSYHPCPTETAAGYCDQTESGWENRGYSYGDVGNAPQAGCEIAGGLGSPCRKK